MATKANTTKKAPEFKHFEKGAVTYDGDDVSKIKVGESVPIAHAKKFDAVALDGSKVEVKPTDSFGTVTPMTSDAAAALRKAFRENTFNLYVDKNSSVEFSGHHVPTGLVTNGSHLKVSKGASVQHVQMSKSDITWDKGVIKNTTFENSKNGKDDLATGGGYLTNSVIKNSQIGMPDNRLSKVTLDRVVAGNVSGHDSVIESAKATKTVSHMPMIANSSFANTHVKTGLDSTIMDSSFTNATVNTTLANDFDHAQAFGVALTDLNKDVAAKTGYTVSQSKLSDVIATAPVTASGSTIGGKPWHPIVVDAPLDATNTTIDSKVGAVVSSPDHKPIVLDKGKNKSISITDKDLQHNVEGFKLNQKGTKFKALTAMDHGMYGLDAKGKSTITESKVRAVVDEAQKAPQVAVNKGKTASPKAATKVATKAKAKTTAKAKTVENDGPEL